MSLDYIQHQLDTFLNSLDEDEQISNFIENQLSDVWHPAINHEYTKYILEHRNNTSIYDWFEKYNASEIAALISEWYQKELEKQIQERKHSIHFVFPDVESGKASAKATEIITKKAIRRLKEIAVDNNFNPELNPEYREYLIEHSIIVDDEVSFFGLESYMNWVADVKQTMINKE